MTFNIRRRVPHLNRRSPDVWSRRREPLKRMLKSEQPTVLGLQEALPDQVAFVAASLGCGYRSIGYGRRADRSDEHCAVFYDSHRLELLDWDQRALSDTPGVPGSATWGNWFPRVAVCATFRDRVTGCELLIVNTHADHLSGKSRLRSAEAIRAYVRLSERPAVVMGDFNAAVGSKPHRELVGGGSLRDTWTAAQERVTEPWGTFPHYRRPRHGGKRIDWILASPSIEVLAAGINVTRYGGAWPSDHAAVHAVVRCGGGF